MDKAREQRRRTQPRTRQWSLVDRATGRVLSIHQGATPPAKRVGVDVREGGSLDEQWRSGKFVALQDFGVDPRDRISIKADGNDVAAIVVPAGAIVRGRDAEGRWRDEVNDGLYELTTDIPGPIVLRLDAPGYRPVKVRIHAT